MKIKICHVAHQTWPSICGSVSRLENILAAQKKTGIDVFVVSSPFQVGSTKEPVEEHNGVSYFRCTSAVHGSDEVKNHRTLLERVKRGLSILKYTNNLIDICRKENPDIIHAHATFIMGISALIAGFVLNKKVIYEMRSTWEDDICGGVFINLQKRIIRFLEFFAGKNSDFIIFVSKGIMCHYYKEEPKNSKVIYNCVPLGRENSQEKESEKHLYTFGYVGSIVYYEGLETLINATASLLKQRSDFQVIIYGDGKERLQLEALAENLGISNVLKFHGRIDFSEIHEAYNNIDAIVLPRKDLPITQKVAGLKPIEAFTYRKLVLASDVGGMRELFDDKVHGYLFEPENSEGLSGLMSLAIDNKLKAQEITNCAFEYYENRFTLESMGAQYLAAYKSTLERSSPSQKIPPPSVTSQKKHSR